MITRFANREATPAQRSFQSILEAGEVALGDAKHQINREGAHLDYDDPFDAVRDLREEVARAVDDEIAHQVEEYGLAHVAGEMGVSTRDEVNAVIDDARIFASDKLEDDLNAQSA